MENQKNAKHVVDGLIRINNDRIHGYEKAIKEVGDGENDLKSLFSNFKQQSQSLKTDLESHIHSWEIENEDKTTASGKVFRAWMDVKSFFSGNDRKAMLESCEFGEDAAQKAYQEALEVNELPMDTRALLENQKTELLAAHNQVKQLRDLEKSK